MAGFDTELASGIQIADIDAKVAGAEPGFIPSMWSDEIVAAYKSNLVMAPLVTRLNHKGKKGDTIFIPSPARNSANVKAVEDTVTLNTATGSQIGITINKHYEYSVLIEDMAEVQALASMRRFYTEDAGYALAKQVDTDIIQLARSARGGSGTAAYTKGVYLDANGIAGGPAAPTDYVDNTSTVVDLNDNGIRDMIQYLDDQDTPMDSRFLIVPPSQRNVLMGIARFTEQAFVGEVGKGNTIRNGWIGDLYGVPVYVTTNYDTTTTAGESVCVFGHKGWSALVEQMGIRSQTQYKQEYLATLMTSDTIYGVGEIRDGSALAVVVP